MSAWADNPVWQRELRRRAAFKGPTILAAVNLGLLALMGLGMYALNAWAMNSQSVATLRDGVADLWWFLATAVPHAEAYAIVAVATALNVAEEREFRTVDSLRLSPLTPVEFLVGKSLVPLRYATCVLPLVLIGFGWSNYSAPRAYWNWNFSPTAGATRVSEWLGYQAPFLLVWLALCGAAGLFAGARCETRRAAVVWSLVLPLVLLVGVVIGFLGIWFGSFTFGSPFAAWVVFLLFVLLAAVYAWVAALNALAYVWNPIPPAPPQ